MIWRLVPRQTRIYCMKNSRHGEGRNRYLLVAKLILLTGLLCLLVQPTVYSPIHYYVRNVWLRMKTPKRVIPDHIRHLVSVVNASRILNDNVDVFREKGYDGQIPKIFHQIYANDQIPDVYVPLIRSWIKHHPDWEYWLWDDYSGRRLVELHYPKFLPLYDSYCHDLFRSDALRYFVLNKFGGVYIDMDYENFRNIQPLIKDKQCLLVQENAPQAALLYRVPDMVMNAMMLSVPGHPYMEFVINLLPSHASCSFDDVLRSTGPLMIYKARKHYINITRCNSYEACYVHILPSTQMMPQWDPEAVKMFKVYCRRKPLTKLQMASCKAIAKLNFTLLPPIPATAYASHKFMHIGNYAKKYKALRRWNITDIVPRAICPSDDKI